MATDPQSLITAGKCYACFTSSTVEIMRLALLSAISKAHNAANQTDPQSLLTQANCFLCFSNESTADLLELALLAQIAS